MAARKTAAEKAEEERKLRRSAARAKRRAGKRLEAALAAGNEEEPVNPAALGIPQQQAAGRVSPRKVTEARANLADAFDLMGGVPALVKWGKSNPTEFYRIWARLIPKEAAEETNRLPLEDLLSKLSERAEMSVAAAAVEIGQEALDAAGVAVSIEDAVAAFQRQEGETVQ